MALLNTFVLCALGAAIIAMPLPSIAVEPTLQLTHRFAVTIEDGDEITDEHILSVALSKDATRCLVGLSDSRIQLLDLHARKPVCWFPNLSPRDNDLCILALAFTGNEDQVDAVYCRTMIGQLDRCVRWDAIKGKQLEIVMNESAMLSAIVAQGRGPVLLSKFRRTGDLAIQFVPFQMKQFETIPLEGLTKDTSFQVLRDGRLLWTAENKRVLLGSSEGLTLSNLCTFNYESNAIALLDDQKGFILYGDEGALPGKRPRSTVELRSLTDGRRHWRRHYAGSIRRVVEIPGKNCLCAMLATEPDERKPFAPAQGQVVVCSLTDGHEIAKWVTDCAVSSCSVSADGSVLVTVPEFPECSSSLDVWDIAEIGQ